jgi:hypothetical protein
VGELADWLSAIDDTSNPADSRSGELADPGLDDDLARALADAIEHGPSNRPMPQPDESEIVPPWLRGGDAQQYLDGDQPIDQGISDAETFGAAPFGGLAPEPRTVEAMGSREEPADGDDLFAPDALPPIDSFLAVIEGREVAKASRVLPEIEPPDEDMSWTNDLKSWLPADDDILPTATKNKGRSKHTKKGG